MKTVRQIFSAAEIGAILALHAAQRRGLVATPDTTYNLMTVINKECLISARVEVQIPEAKEGK